MTEEIEAQATLADLQERMADVQRLARVGDWIWDRASGEVRWSAQLHEITGVDPVDFGGDLEAHLAAFGPDEREDLYRLMQAAADARSPFETDCVIVRPDGTRRWMHLSGEPVDDPTGRSGGLRGICQDITERKEAMEALEEADRLKDEFLGVVSHELRTPLTSILGFGQILADRTPEDLREIAGIVVRNAKEMHDIVGRVLDFSRARSGRIELVVAEHGVDDLVDEVLPLVDPLLAHHEVHVERAGLRVLADADAMRRILVNLLTNAAKFTPDGRQISISSESTDGRVRIVVADEGPGIPDDEREAIFERFYRIGDSAVSSAGGTGVGLSIVKTYAQAMDGRVWVESRPGGGSRFVVDLSQAVV